MTHLIGAHLSIAGGYYKSLESAQEKGANCLQIFSSSPRTWKAANPTDEDIQRFLELKKEHQIEPIYFHACYLCNLADIDATGEKTKQVLIHELNLAKKMKVKGSIIHTGSFKGNNVEFEGKYIKDNQMYKSLIEDITSIINETPKETLLILENAGNRKIGQTIDQLSQILEDINDERVRVCLDTCHLHAAGYKLQTEEDFDTFLAEFNLKIGLNKLEIIHVNDSKDELGALRDRHENLGEGKVGIEVFKNLLNHEKTKHLPFVIETPGFDKKGPDKKNIDILKSWIV